MCVKKYARLVVWLIFRMSYFQALKVICMILLANQHSQIEAARPHENKATEVKPASHQMIIISDHLLPFFCGSKTRLLCWLHLSYYPLAEEDFGFLSLRHAKSNILEAFSRRLVSRVENYLALYSYQVNAKIFDMKGRSYRLLTCWWT